jgi:hypothetical protein
MSASLIGRLGQALSGYPPLQCRCSLTGSRFSSDSAPRPFHHGDSKTRWNNLWRDLAVEVTAGSSGHTNSPHPSSREGHHSTVGWVSGFLLFDLILYSCHAAATSLVHRNAVPSIHTRCMITANRRASATNRLLDPAMPGDLHCPGLKPGPFRRTHQHALGSRSRWRWPSTEAACDGSGAFEASDCVTSMRTGTLKAADFTGSKTYVLADGSNVPSQTFRIRSLKVGDKVVENVNGSTASAKGSPLLGQSFLSRFKSWSIDNNRHVLVLE